MPKITRTRLAESLRRHLDAMRTELAGPNPSPMDKLLVDRVLASHVQALYFEAIETTDPTGENLRVARYRMDRRDQAHRHFLSAVKMLATVRNLVAKTKVIQVELLNPPVVRSPAAPIVSTANGDEPKSCSSHMDGARNGCGVEAAKQEESGRRGKPPKESPVNGSAQRINGHGRMNGNRIAHLVGTAAGGESE